MGRGAFWNGKNFVIPQAASTIDSSALSQAPLGGANRLAILGDMLGLLAPKSVTKVSNAALAKQLIHPKSEEARLAVDLAFGPSKGGELAGASEVYLVPVAPSTQATLTLDTKVQLSSYLYGQAANQIKAKVEAGTTVGTKVTIGYEAQTEIFDNLAKNSFSIVYTGLGTPATMTIDPTASGHVLTTTCTGALGDNLALNLTTYATIQQLADAIEATGKYTVEILTDRPSDLSLALDGATAVDILTVYTATSNLQAVVDGLRTSAYVAATRVTDAVAAPSPSAWAFLAAGGDGAITNNDWQEAFDALKAIDIDLVVPLSSASAIHAMADAHCLYMSGPSGKSERRAFVGGALQAWTSEANRASALTALRNAAKALNSDRTLHVGLGSTHYDPAGAPKLYPAYLTACCYAGIAAGAAPQLPLTRKYLNVLGLEVDLRISESETLIEAGVGVPIPDAVNGAGYVVSRQVTTWLQSDDLYRVEFSVGRVADYVGREVRRRLEGFIGQPGSIGLDTTIVNTVNSVLAKTLREGIIRSYDPKLTQLRAENTVRFIDYAAVPVLPVNWIFVTQHLLPTTFTLQV